VRYRDGLAHCARRLIVTAHEAFGYLARRYGLRQEGVAGLSPDAEPDPERIAQLTDLARREGVTVVFTEELVSPRIADTLAREAGVHTDVLNPLEGLTDRERRAGANYITVMDDNLRKLRTALDCK
jgi:zinc transport system substrate-binding protein